MIRRLANLDHANRVAAICTHYLGETWVGTDAGPHCYPRFNAQRAPNVGDDVSYAFNGDSYPCGQVVRVSKSLKVITTSNGDRYFRVKLSGGWRRNRTWWLTEGHVSKYNPSF